MIELTAHGLELAVDLPRPQQRQRGEAVRDLAVTQELVEGPVLIQVPGGNAVVSESGRQAGSQAGRQVGRLGRQAAWQCVSSPLPTLRRYFSASAL